MSLKRLRSKTKHRQRRFIRNLAIGGLIGAGIAITLPITTLILCSDRIICHEPTINLDTLNLSGDTLIDGCLIQDVWIPSADNSDIIRGWFLNHTDNLPRPTVVYFTDTYNNNPQKALHTTGGCNVLIVKYDKNRLNSMVDDAECVLEYVQQRQNHSHHSSDDDDAIKNSVFVGGTALGGAMAIDLAAKYPNIIKGCILEDVYTSTASRLAELVKIANWWPWLLDRMVKNVSSKDGSDIFNSFVKIKHVKTPTLFIANNRLPSHHMIDLMSQSDAICKWFISLKSDSSSPPPPLSSVEKESLGDQKNPSNEERYLQTIKSFINQCQNKRMKPRHTVIIER